jgi:hypothetical protein
VKKSFLILVNSSCVPAGASTLYCKIANGMEKLEPVSIEVLSSSFFFLFKYQGEKFRPTENGMLYLFA